MEQHTDGTAAEINAGRELVSAISRMTPAERARLPADVQSAYDDLWLMWVARRAAQHQLYCIGELPELENAQ